MTQFVEAGPSFQLQDLILAPNTLSQCHFHLTNWFPTKVLCHYIFSKSTRRWESFAIILRVSWGVFAGKNVSRHKATKILQVARTDNFGTTRAVDLGSAIIRETTRGYDGLRSEDPPRGHILRVEEPWPIRGRSWLTLANEKRGLRDSPSLCQLPRESRKRDETPQSVLWHRQTITSFIRSVSFIEQELSRTDTFIDVNSYLFVILTILQSSSAWSIPSHPHWIWAFPVTTARQSTIHISSIQDLQRTSLLKRPVCVK